MVKHNLAAISALLFTLITACGDNGSSGSINEGPIFVGDPEEETNTDTVESILGDCTEKNKGKIKQVPDSLASEEESRYICKNEKWRLATVFEYDTYEWKAKDDGTVKKGLVTDTFYKYDELQNRWVSTNENDRELNLKGCTEKRDGEIGKGNDGKNYVCDNSSWRLETNIEKKVGIVCTKSSLKKEIEIVGPMKCSSPGAWVSTTSVPGTMTDSRDGKSYKTVGIGTQTWMAENLNYDYKVAGESYGSYCYADELENCALYGRLYTWGAAIDTLKTGCGDRKGCSQSGKARGICPTGWHLPDTTEWSILFASVGAEWDADLWTGGSWTIAGKMLKSTKSWNNSKDLKDPYEFSALAAGYEISDCGLLCLSYPEYSELGDEAYFWTSTDGDPSNADMNNWAYHAAIIDNYDFAQTPSSSKFYGYSVRCVKDEK